MCSYKFFNYNWDYTMSNTLPVQELLDHLPNNELLLMRHKAKYKKLFSNEGKFFILEKQRKSNYTTKYAGKNNRKRKKIFFTEEIKKYLNCNRYVILTDGSRYLHINKNFLIPKKIFKKIKNVTYKNDIEKKKFIIKSGNNLLLIDLLNINNLDSLILEEPNESSIRSRLKFRRTSANTSIFEALIKKTNNEVITYLKQNKWFIITYKKTLYLFDRGLLFNIPIRYLFYINQTFPFNEERLTR